jgi:1-deoxy-D-xylulose-5-phosphate synthase
MRFVKPLDHDLLNDITRRFTSIVTIEDHARIGGFGSAIAEWLSANNATTVRHLTLGIPDRFVDHGSPQELSAEVGLDVSGILSSIRAFSSPPPGNT